MDDIIRQDSGMFSFSDRLARIQSRRFHRQTTQNRPSDQFNFRDSLPRDRPTMTAPPVYESLPEKQPAFNSSYINLPQQVPPKRRPTTINTGNAVSIARPLAWPIAAITIPIAMLATTLLLIVFEYQVRTEESLFQPSANSRSDNLFLLVDYSATRLVFVASFLSTVAPILSSFIMTLYSRSIAKMMRVASVEHDMLKLPTPYQLSLVVGLTLASTDRLRSYFGYVWSKSKRAHVPPVLHRAAAIFSLSLLLAAAVFVTDTALHYFTTTIEFDRLSQPTHAPVELGRGLSSRCLNFDRFQNSGFPCSWDVENPENLNETVNDALLEMNEVNLLRQNISTQSAIQFIKIPNLGHSDLALLMPSQDLIPSDLDYRASTIAVSTQCSLITPQCNPFLTSTTTMTTHFNCSKNFYGMLGNQVTLDVNGTWPLDPDASPLTYKPATNLDWAYFTDESLQDLYNTNGYSTDLESDLPILPDENLVNPIWLGFAARYGRSAEAAGSSLFNQTGFFCNQSSMVDFIVSCSITSYDATYDRVAGSVENVNFSETKNGSVLEIYHGSQLYSGLGAAYDLQNDLQVAVLADSPEALLGSWGNSFSMKVLSSIGAQSTPRLTIQEQTRTRLLVARVPKPALGALVGFSLLYTLLGLALGITAYRASSEDVQDLAAQLSLAGLTAAAFEDRESKGANLISSFDDAGSNNQRSARGDCRRIVADGNPANGYEFRAWV